MQIIKFGAEWCGQCQVIKNILNEVKCKLGPEESSNIKFRELNVDEDDGSKYADRYGVTSLPAIIMIDDSGVKKFHLVGVLSSQNIIDEIDKNLW